MLTECSHKGAGSRRLGKAERERGTEKLSSRKWNVVRMRLLQLCQAHSASPAGAELGAVPRHMLQTDGEADGQTGRQTEGQTNRHAVLAIMPGHKGDKGKCRLGASTRTGASVGAETGAGSYRAEHALSLAVSS